MQLQKASAEPHSTNIKKAVTLVCLQELLHLLPAMQQRLLKLQPRLLAAWASDTGAVAAKLLVLRDWMPQADVARLVALRCAQFTQPVLSFVLEDCMAIQIQREPV